MSEEKPTTGIFGELDRPPARPIVGQVIYAGPMLPHLGLQYGAIFKNGIHPHLYNAISQCPAIGELFVPIHTYSKVRRELNFDMARNMRGTIGKYVAFYRQVETWRASKKVRPPTPTTGVEIKHA
jgi:hypothetical protein